MTEQRHYDAVIIGGGIYGTTIALHLSQIKGKEEFKKILILEQAEAIMQRASYNNQARVHNGYHYPRSFTTAYRSRINLPRFLADYPDAIKTDFTKLYAIARSGSLVNSMQFSRFCEQIGASLQPAPQHLEKLFNPQTIENVYLTQEYAFDTKLLAQHILKDIAKSPIELKVSTHVQSVVPHAKGLEVRIHNTHGGPLRSITARKVFNCTYSNLNRFSPHDKTPVKLKHEITEMALVTLPDELSKLGITVMDGPFFSLMPFPAKGLHTLSHVRYTPHLAWEDTPDVSPYSRLAEYPKVSRANRMIRDAARYLPSISLAESHESLFEVKTVLKKNESDDGRPILFKHHDELHGFYSILGGKIDNIYDIFEQLDKALTTDFPAL